MKLLIVGGTGFIGGYTALYMQANGHDVTIMSRSKPKGRSQLNNLPHISKHYVEDDINDGCLEGYDGMLFCAGADLGVYPTDNSISKEDFFEQYNSIGVPRFFEAAKNAGIPRTVYLSSFYPMVMPDSDNVYVKSRQNADDGALALSCASFNVCSLGIPWILGYIPGCSVPHWHGLSQIVAGKLPGRDDFFAPPGGANYMSCHSVAEAMEGGLLRGESGKAYLVGDTNLSWKAFFEHWFTVAGHPRELDVREDDHPLIPNEVIAYVEGKMAHYEPPENETKLLGYQQNVAIPMIKESYEYYSQLNAP